MLFSVSILLFPIQQGTDDHDDGKDDKIEENREGELSVFSGGKIGTDAVRVDGDTHHE